MSRTADRYAKALFSAAESSGAIDEIAAEFEGLQQVFDDATIRDALTEPDVPRESVRKLLAKLGEGRHTLTRNLFGVLDERRRVSLLMELPSAFARLVRASRNELEGVVESSHDLGDEGRSHTEQLAKKLSGGKTVHLQHRTRSDLLGGIRLQIGNTLYDGSLKTQLEDLQDRLLSAPLNG